MTDIIKVIKASYDLSEEVLMKRENLRKEGHQSYVRYLQIFGELMTESFRKKIECIRKKKMIAFCQRCLNQGIDINSIELNDFIRTEMHTYEEQLKEMIREAKNAAEARTLSAFEIRKIKEIYYRLAHKIHPDMRPELADNKHLMDYWNRIVIVYQNNQLGELEELEALVNSCLSDIDGKSEDIQIENIDKKIEQLEKEIERIISTTPYTYRFLLEDENKVEQKKEELQNEIREYDQYSAELEGILKKFPIKEMYA